MMKYFWVLSLGLTVFSICSPSLAGAKETVMEVKRDQSLRYEIEHSIEKGLNWLSVRQNEDGSWSQHEYPALTALVLTAFAGEPSGKYLNKKPAFINKGYEYILGNVQPNGGIYNKEAQSPLESYNTSISMMALIVAHDPAYESILLNARKYLVSLQNNGGIGYNKSGHSDMSNTVIALEALHYSNHIARDPRQESTQLDLQAAIKFIERCQNLPSVNLQSWASNDPENRGGFVYHPEESKAGEAETESGKKTLRSYGSMSYAGLLSYIYADLDKDDPRVKAVYDWLRKNYTLEENPGMGAQGLYYYYQIMAKALSTLDIDELELQDGSKINWRKNLAVKFLSLQNGDHGNWINENGRWWEKDPVLVTSYSLIALEMLHRGL